MSTISYDYNPNSLSVEDIRKIAREENNKGKYETWTNPVTGNCHKVSRGTVPYGATSVPNEEMQDMWKSTPIVANIYTAKQGASKLAAGKMNEDSARYAPFSHEFQDTALGYYKLMEDVAYGKIGEKKAAGIIANSDYQSIAEPVLSSEVFDLTFREYVLEQAVTQKTSDVIKVALPGRVTSAKPVAKGLGEFDIPDSHNISYAVAEMTLQKAAARFEISTWFGLTARRFNVEADTKRQIELDFPRIYDEEIRDRLNSFTDTAGTSWVANTAGISTNDPAVAIEARLAAIATSGGTPNTMVLHPSAFNALVANTYMKPTGLLNLTAKVTDIDVNNQLGGPKQLEKISGINIYTARTIPSTTIAYIFDKRTVELYKGPSRVGNYEDILGSYKGTLIERWYGSTVIESTWGSELTGVGTTP